MRFLPWGWVVAIAGPILIIIISRVFTRMEFFGEKVAENAKIRGSQTRFLDILSQKETPLKIMNK